MLNAKELSDLWLVREVQEDTGVGFWERLPKEEAPRASTDEPRLRGSLGSRQP